MDALVPELWHPFTQLRGFSPLGEVVRAEGPWLTLADGRRLLDGNSSWWVNLHGHAHPAIQAAITAQAAAFDQVIFADFTHAPARQLVAALLPRLPSGLEHVFLSDDGSTSVEVAIKMAWQAARAHDPRRTRLVAFRGAYHGDTLGAMAVGDRDVFTAPFAGLLLDVVFLPYDEPDAAEAWFAEHGHTAVAAIIEPMVQCAGGMRFWSAEGLARTAAAARRAGALWIADEVAVGFGRTGKMWGSDHAGVAPDLLCMSKGITGGTLPLGATACTGELFRRFLGADKRTAFLHGHSYTGNPLACAAAVASLALMEERDTVGRFARLGAAYASWADRFRALPTVTDVRWLGGIFAMEVAGGGGYLAPVGAAVQEAALRRGLYCRPLGGTVYLMPPAALSDAEADFALSALHDAIAEVVTRA
jgi:adenosylmethionine-8-amino-7-oxononanoate aminotransferase